MESKYADRMLSRTKKALENHGFKVFIASTRKDAVQKVLGLIPVDAMVGVGGSVTIRELGLIRALTKRGNRVVHHWLPDVAVKDWLPYMVEAHSSAVFLCSSNAVTEDGKLVNLDSTGNRVASMIFGPGSVIVVAGRNKIVRNVDAGLKRLKEVAGPLNAKRHNLVELPCVKTGVCTDCDSPKRVCRVITIIERAPNRVREPHMTVVLVAEDLGF
ncbi:MAG: lactate utilization protein [Candidatus Bathyarchaeia archaeon]